MTWTTPKPATCVSASKSPCTSPPSKPRGAAARPPAAAPQHRHAHPRSRLRRRRRLSPVELQLPQLPGRACRQPATSAAPSRPSR
jgi:hypothetical protein